MCRFYRVRYEHSTGTALAHRECGYTGRPARCCDIQSGPGCPIRPRPEGAPEWQGPEGGVIRLRREAGRG